MYHYSFRRLSIRHAESVAILRAGAAPVVQAGGGDVDVTEPLLHFAQVSAPIQRRSRHAFDGRHREFRKRARYSGLRRYLPAFLELRF
jgi:hypothetical protein